MILKFLLMNRIRFIKISVSQKALVAEENNVLSTMVRIAYGLNFRGLHLSVYSAKHHDLLILSYQNQQIDLGHIPDTNGDPFGISQNR
jgi:hypothetical protein